MKHWIGWCSLLLAALAAGLLLPFAWLFVLEALGLLVVLAILSYDLGWRAGFWHGAHLHKKNGKAPT